MRGVEHDPRQYFNEGFTEFIANRTLVRDKLIAPEVYMQRMQTQLALYTYFRWSDQYDSISIQRAGTNKTQYRFGVYQGGWTVAFCLDGIIREQTHDQHSLDDVLRRMYDQFGVTNTPYRTEDIARTAGEVADTDLTEFFARYVAGTEALPVKACLERMGFEGFGKPYAAELYVFRNPRATIKEVARRRNLMGVP
jgi:predicted metalloprotease with PDZ domain